MAFGTEANQSSRSAAKTIDDTSNALEYKSDLDFELDQFARREYFHSSAREIILISGDEMSREDVFILECNFLSLSVIITHYSVHSRSKVGKSL